MAAFRMAIEAGVDMIELDVHLTADEEVVVIHDQTLQRTTTGNGPVRSYSRQELHAFDAGSWFDPAFASERIPTLHDVLMLARNRCRVNIELKSHPFHRELRTHYGRKVLETVASAGMGKDVLMSSFDHRLLAEVHSQDPGVVIGVLQTRFRSLWDRSANSARDIGASVFICSRRALRSSLLDSVHQSGLAVFVYSVNDPDDAERLAARSVDGLISDDPARLQPRFTQSR